MAVPKKKQSPSRRDMRRANYDRRTAPAVVSCTNCQEMVLPHHVCPSCGYYKGRQVIAVAQD